MEALVNPATGEIICVKPDNAMWGRVETKLFQVVRWDSKDAVDVAVARKLKDSSDPRPAVSLPYLRTTRPGGLPVIVAGERESTKYVDLGELPVELRQRILDKQTRVPKVGAGVRRASKRPLPLTDDE